MIVGICGLGNMGAPIAANVAAAGFELHGYDVAGTIGRLPGGASGAGSVAELAQRCDTVLVSVPDGAASASVMSEIAAATDRRTTAVIDVSTIGPLAARVNAALLASAGVDYGDAPVSGGVAGARAGTITLMFGGARELFDTHRELLRSFAAHVYHVGLEAGHGQAMKLVNNVLSATALAATSEALALGQACGLDLATMLDVVNVSSGRNTATSDKFPNRVLTGTYDAGFSTRLMTKDVELFEQVAAELGAPRTVTGAVADTWRACDAARPGSDFSEIWTFVSG